MYKVAVSYLLTGDNLNAQNAFKAVTLMPQPYFDEDKYAYKMSKQYLEKKANETDLNLLKARYFFDGGFYESAIRTLNLINIESSALTVENKVEYYYRKGRIFHETNEFTQAKRHYLQAIVYKTEKPNWMVVYSLFYLGKILASENSEEAKRYFRRALSFDGYDYQAGLEQKVKAALSGLN
jgi:tetratricopeptide (TPR) repeat protein